MIIKMKMYQVLMSRSSRRTKISASPAPSPPLHHRSYVVCFAHCCGLPRPLSPLRAHLQAFRGHPRLNQVIGCCHAASNKVSLAASLFLSTQKREAAHRDYVNYHSAPSHRHTLSCLHLSFPFVGPDINKLFSHSTLIDNPIYLIL